MTDIALICLLVALRFKKVCFRESLEKESVDLLESVLSVDLVSPGGCAGCGGVLKSGGVLCREPLLTSLASVPPRMKGRGEDLGGEMEAIRPVQKTSRNVFWWGCPCQSSSEFSVAQLSPVELRKKQP